ncbi:hypothetical protein Y032_0256g355 [Ancylostoma ceylanicum]|uniref:Uncharacterized protein n=1 Tax=Ancylostoma ceylanicum TaxID=53326 RepID=A0A016SBU5_9BILA|nr:hypothetical protein Y032_0256g355 [Ancylostoma ceylanicum]
MISTTKTCADKVVCTVAMSLTYEIRKARIRTHEYSKDLNCFAVSSSPLPTLSVIVATRPRRRPAELIQVFELPNHVSLTSTQALLPLFGLPDSNSEIPGRPLPSLIRYREGREGSGQWFKSQAVSPGCPTGIPVRPTTQVESGQAPGMIMVMLREP